MERNVIAVFLTQILYINNPHRNSEQNLKNVVGILTEPMTIALIVGRRDMTGK
jgi:hypothetical protein